MTDYFKPQSPFILLPVPLSCGSGESSTGALWVRYWDEPWDFLCFWAFLMDFLVKPSTFSVAEMADILMHKLTKTSDKLLYPQVKKKGFLLRSHRSHQQQKYGANRTTWSSSSSHQVLCYSVWSNMVAMYRGVRLSPWTASFKATPSLKHGENLQNTNQKAKL